MVFLFKTPFLNMFKPQKDVLNKKNMFKTMFLQFKTKNSVLFICFLPSKNHGFALGHLQASFYVLNIFKDGYKSLSGGQF
jgi:hypothetical protein